MKKKHYIFLAVAFYFVFLIASIPAKFVTDLINNNSSISISGVSGTVWNGNAYIISINTSTQLKDTSWSLSLWKLLIGQLSADISSHYLNNKIKTEIGTSLLGTFFVNNLTANIAAEDVARLAEIPLVQLSGSIAVDIEHAEWSQEKLPLATGLITWNNATVTVDETASLGNINILLGESEQGALIADINNQGGDIKISGSAQLVPEADYAVDIILTPTKSATSSITQSLGLFSQRQSNGDFLLKNAGSLNNTGLI